MTLQHMTIITLTLRLMVTLGSVFITGIVASRHHLKYESFYLEELKIRQDGPR